MALVKEKCTSENKLFPYFAGALVSGKKIRYAEKS